jgi:hypothetical protein
MRNKIGILLDKHAQIFQKYEPFQNPRCQKGDLKRVLYQAHTNIRHHHTKLVATMTWHPDFVHPCFWFCLSLSISL